MPFHQTEEDWKLTTIAIGAMKFLMILCAALGVAASIWELSAIFAHR